MNSFNYTEKDLDVSYIGQLDLFQADDYKTQKAGTEGIGVVIRSQINKEKNVIRLVSHISKRYNTNRFPMDGTVGLYGKIQERTFINKDQKTINNVDTLFIYHVDKTKISNVKCKTNEGYYVLESTCEFDDMIFNLNDDYTFPIYYYIDPGLKRYLIGVMIEIPIDKFNKYVQMRDLWYHDYQGSKII